MAHAHVQAYQVIQEKRQTKNWPSFSHNFSRFNRPTINDICLDSKKSMNMSEQPACHDLLIVLRYVMKSRVICTGCLIGIVYTFSLLYLFYATAVVPLSTGVRTLNCQILYVEMGGKGTVLYRTVSAKKWSEPSASNWTKSSHTIHRGLWRKTVALSIG